MPGCASANRPRRLTSHLAAKSGDVLTVRTPELWRWIRRSVPTAMRSNASRRTIEIVATGFGDDQPLALAIEELDAELRFQRLDLMAHGSLRDAQLFGGSREALMPRRGLEGLERVQRRKAAKHVATFMRKTKAG